MPQRWQKEVFHAHSSESVSESNIVTHDDDCRAEPVFSNGGNQPSGGRNSAAGRPPIALRKTGLDAHRRERPSSTVLRDRCQRNSGAGRSTSDRTLYERHDLRHQRKPGVGTTLRRWHAQLRNAAIRWNSQAKQRESRLVQTQERTSENRKFGGQRFRDNSTVDQLLKIKSQVSSALYAPFRAILLCFFLAALVPLGAANAAASLVIKPTRIIITQDAPVAVITIDNQGTSEAVIQLQLMSWAQENGADIYGPSDTLGVLACPSMFNIPPGGSQIVRIGLEDMARNWDTEGTFRLFIQEIPSQIAEDASAVQVAMRIGVPVFLPPKNSVQPTLNWQIKTGDQGGVWMTAVNEGTSHALVSGIQLKQGDFLFQANTHQYILPGATISWRVDLANPIAGALPDSVEMLASTDQGSYEETLQIDR